MSIVVRFFCFLSFLNGLSRSHAAYLRDASQDIAGRNTTTVVTTALSQRSLSRRLEEQGLPLLQVVGVEGNVTPSLLPLSKCQGDCNRNSDCEGNLMCFQRGGATTIPGCAGLAPLDGIDYCWDPMERPPEGVVARVGNDGNPSALFPLGRCQGDCDDDTECAGDLICFQRTRNIQFVPGCVGEPSMSDATNFCVGSADLPAPFRNAHEHSQTTATTTTTTDAPIVTTTTNEIATTTSTSGELFVLGPNPPGILKLCEADCDLDSDCEGDLVCFQRFGSENIPGCTGVPRDYYDYCVDPTASLVTEDSSAEVSTVNFVIEVGNDWRQPGRFPLGKCQADCDSNSDCKEGLVCFQRNFGHVPGCLGNPEDYNDYCVDPEDLGGMNGPSRFPGFNGPSRLPGSNGPTRFRGQRHPNLNALLQLCQGNCASDADCAGNLVCVGRNVGPVPGCAFNPRHLSYCVLPRSPPATAAAQTKSQLSFVGNNWEEPSDFPLKLCEGDCDGDFDCEGDLVCHQRDIHPDVPSCAGLPIAGTDYCVRVSDELARPPESESFRVKLFWEFGYDWQEVFWELEWCMRCSENDCAIDAEILLQTCTEDSTWFAFENLSGKRTQLRVALTNLCMELDSLDGSRGIRLRTCDASNERQIFHSGDQWFTDEFFEIQTTAVAGCLTQEHHPRHGELVYRQECERPRRDNTNFWQKY